MKVTIVKDGKAKRIPCARFLKSKRIFKGNEKDVSLDDVIEITLSKNEYLKLININKNKEE